jgi:hypothetical protein
MLFYPKNDYPVNWEYVTGRYCAHNWLDRIGRVRLAVDLYLGRKRLVQPTMPIAAFAARIHPASAWQEYQRQLDRLAYQHRAEQAVAQAEPPASVVITRLENPDLVPPAAEIADCELVNIDRMLQTAMLADAHH